ncbi:hypothetical protein WJX73_001651 [Symbiochloris irregularis]|uniref:BZIP domain-containing protein n=1 Tax=Symbiochloris irregularis TaxID=706552 RepID=A0AAW1P1B2_9CHLO
MSNAGRKGFASLPAAGTRSIAYYRPASTALVCQNHAQGRTCVCNERTAAAADGSASVPASTSGAPHQYQLRAFVTARRRDKNPGILAPSCTPEKQTDMPGRRAVAGSPNSMQTARLRSSERLAPAVTPPVSQQESCSLQEAESGLPSDVLGSSPQLARLLAGCRPVQRRSRSKVDADPYDENGKRRSQEEMRRVRRRITNRNSARHMRKVRAEEEEETRREVESLLQENLRMQQRLTELEGAKKDADAWKRVAQTAIDRAMKLRARLAFYEQDSDVLQGLISHSSISNDSGAETFVGETDASLAALRALLSM